MSRWNKIETISGVAVSISYFAVAILFIFYVGEFLINLNGLLQTLVMIILFGCLFYGGPKLLNKFYEKNMESRKRIIVQIAIFCVFSFSTYKMYSDINIKSLKEKEERELRSRQIIAEMARREKQEAIAKAYWKTTASREELLDKVDELEDEIDELHSEINHYEDDCECSCN